MQNSVKVQKQQGPPGANVELLQAAIGYLQAGMSILPIRSDGSKRPIGKWERYQTSRMTEADAKRHFRNGSGIGIIGGKVSGGLEIIDIDHAELFYPFVGECQVSCPGLLERLPIVKTPNGYHVYYRCETIEGNQKLAQCIRDDGKVKTLIETRGTGGYVLAPGCPPTCHPSGRLYEHIDGPPVTEVPIITVDERSVLLRVARSFDEVLEPAIDSKPCPQGEVSGNSRESPGDAYNSVATWEEILEPHGWTIDHTSGNTVHWKRPGKDSPGSSATTGLHSSVGNDLLCVFSTNAHPFKGATVKGPCTTYTKFAAYALLNHVGDFSEAARKLGRNGFGDPARPGQTQPGRNGKPDKNPYADKGTRAIYRILSDVEPQEIKWHWPGRIAQGKLTLIAGDPGIGKSFLSLDTVARTSLGSKWPDSNDCAPLGSVVVMNAEDGVEDTIVPRLIAAGADMTKIAVIDGIKGSDEGGPYERHLDLVRDVHHVEEVIASLSDCRLVIIDPISAYCGNTDSHKNAEVRGLLAPLAAMAERMNVAVIAISHLRKGAGPAMYRTMGSLAFIAAARAAWCVVRDKENPERRLFLPVKNNLAADTKGLAYGLDAQHSFNGQPIVAWEPGEVDIAADEAMSDGKGGQGSLDEAVRWLMDALADGPAEAKDIKGHAEADGISARTLMRAKKYLGVISTRNGYQAPWTWMLPGVAR